MNDVASAPPPPITSQNHHYLFFRRHSISKSVVVPVNTLHHHHSSSSSATTSTGDLDLISIKPVSYISLKDLLPSTPVNSPKSKSPAQSCSSEISIKNRLVKQAACAYLQPMSTSPDSSARNFLHRLRSFFHRHILRRLNHAVDCLLRAIRLRCFR
ncbi:hypothetical protein ACH5RR_005667 [Cinchona calisaya]|uniref:Uncharacterized protein n=1 Tax=Cinchona calisaya TaxID=153742 RepID=A0ABD3AM21_9GENT